MTPAKSKTLAVSLCQALAMTRMKVGCHSDDRALHNLELFQSRSHEPRADSRLGHKASGNPTQMSGRNACFNARCQSEHCERFRAAPRWQALFISRVIC